MDQFSLALVDLSNNCFSEFCRGYVFHPELGIACSLLEVIFVRDGFLYVPFTGQYLLSRSDLDLIISDLATS